LDHSYYKPLRLAGRNNEGVFEREAGDSGREKLINIIDSLKEQLVLLGYNRSEVDYIVQKYAGGKVSELPLDNLCKLEKALKGHLDIANKCMNVR